ncbi:hypothetical protein I8751_25545 [Nostocaceae cyanobacterium CENA357]|uniref:Uncharacterized protein n=1 Tax=Atlanticothrix silvestris CENA357 TaxID=1725252 RepID=A0A8J7HM18_9CYAN|nr:DNA sulfur modification protein DndB [Atlanticothrix silvestris]MBH8555649.1 hypothetical protein [Atlanticothrix silvestris CENA357]
MDDTKLSALIPRKLLEENVLEDKIVKWSSKSTNLTQADPYLTTIDLISKCAVEILIDYKKTALKKTLNSPIDRENAMKNYYESHPKIHHIGTRDIFKWFFYELQPFQDWLYQLEHLGISVPPQPEEIKLQATQKEQLKKLRESNILYTVLGQRIVFFAISRFILRVKAEYRIPSLLDAIAKSIGKMYDKGFLDRNAPHWKNLIVQPNEKLTMITTGSGGDKCIDLLRMIFLNTSDGVRELIKSTREDVDSEVNWTMDMIASWRKQFFVELPIVEFIEDDSTSKEDDEITNFSNERNEDNDEEMFDEIEDEMDDESEINE